MKRLLDLYSGAGGAARGYQMAGFHVTGIDIKPQKHYVGDYFIQTDALEYCAEHGHEYDAIHASPPCQGYSSTKTMSWTRGSRGEVPLLISQTRNVLIATGKPWVIENVEGARTEMPYAITLCGIMFGLTVFRHRLFESSHMMLQPSHVPHGNRRIGVGGFCCVAGHGDSNRGRIPYDHRSVAACREALGIDWMTMEELVEAIPPAYTHFIGLQLIR